MENTNCNCQENIINKVNQVQDFINEKLLDITEAECSRMNNENERIKNETARQKAESNRITNENVRQEGYNKIVEQIDKYTESEKRRQQNELERINNENKRQQQEKCRKDAENIRKELENSRQTAETQRTTSEINRIGSENNRVIAENKRNIAEQNRQQSELIRETQESTRQNNELIRKNQENSRVQAENVREENENKRISAEAARVEAEKKREASEVTRTRTEMERETNEQARQEAESVRKEAESVRKEAESEREAQEQVRVKNEEGRVKNEEARAQAEAARVTAENARVTAEGEREQGFTEKAAHLEELLQYIKDNHLEVDAKLAEAIKNTINGTDEFVYLDGSDGNVKSMPNTRSLGTSAAAVYYAGKRSVMPGESCMVIGYRSNELIRSLDLSGWDFEAATNMYGLLFNASNLRTLTLPDNMTLANVTNMANCFQSCEKLREIDLSSCNITKCENWSYCFAGLMQLETLRIGLIDFSPCGSIDLFLWGTNIRELTGTLRGIRNDFRAVSSRMTRDSCMVVINGLETVTEAKTLTLGVNNKPVSLGGKGSDPISDDDLKIATDKGWTVEFA